MSNIIRIENDFFEKYMNIFSLASVIVGSIIGAGFSTGQEVFYFFTRYGDKSFLYIIISSVMIFLLLMLFLSYKIQNRIIFTIIRMYIFSFSLVSLTVMLSAFGQLGVEFLGLNKYLFTIICFLVSIFLFKQGMVGILNVNKIVVSLMIITIIVFAISDISVKDFSEKVFMQVKNHSINPMPAVLYATYNSLLSLPVIFKLRSKTENRKLKLSILVAFVFILFLLMIINLIIIINPASQTSQMPLLSSCSNIILKKILIICTFLEILTTILANFIGIEYSIRNHNIKIISVCLCLIIGFSSFKTALRVLYTTMGYLGIIILFLILIDTIFLQNR